MFENQTPNPVTPPVAPVTPPPVPPTPASPVSVPVSVNHTEDIFASVDPAQPYGQGAQNQTGQLPPLAPDLEEDGPNNKLLLIVGGSVAGLLVLAVIIWLIISSFGKQPQPVADNNQKATETKTEVPVAPVVPVPVETIKPAEPLVTEQTNSSNVVSASTSVETAQAISETNNSLSNGVATTSAVTTTGQSEVTPVVPEPPVVSTVDTDGDNLTDAEEAQYKTNPLKSDTDDDGLTDYEEVKVYGADPNVADTDGDGFSDGVEVSKGYNPKGAGKLFLNSKKK